MVDSQARKSMMKPSDSTSGAHAPSTPHSQDVAKWEKVKRAARKTWSGVSDDDFQRAQDSVEKLADIIHTKFGETKAVIIGKLTGVPAAGAGKSAHANREDKTKKRASSLGK